MTQKQALYKLRILLFVINLEEQIKKEKMILRNGFTLTSFLKTFLPFLKYEKNFAALILILLSGDPRACASLPTRQKIMSC